MNVKSVKYSKMESQQQKLFSVNLRDNVNNAVYEISVTEEEFHRIEYDQNLVQQLLADAKTRKEQEPNELTEKGKQMWPYNDTVAFINTVQSHYEKLHDVKKKKNFWTVVSQELQSQKLEYSETVCKKKWTNLLRTYKSVKDIKNKSGRGSTRFQFYDLLDEILGENPTNASPHSLDVSSLKISSVQCSGQASEQTSASADELHEVEQGLPRGHGKRKRGSATSQAEATSQFLSYKKQFYQRNEKRQIKKYAEQRRFREEFLMLQQEKQELLRERNRIELRKALALERLAESKSESSFDYND